MYEGGRTPSKLLFRTNSPWVFMDLMILDLVFGHWNTGAIENDETRAGCALVNGTDETIFQVIGATGLILYQRAIAVVGLVGVDIHMALLLLFDGAIQLRHIERILHFWPGDCGCEGGCR